MLINFCDPCLRPEVKCSTVTTEGYEVSNLVNNSSNGFLAYSCIKPPVNIDFTFICNVQVSHILVWPSVGAQKSTGFQLRVKPSDHKNEPFVVVSSAVLQKQDQGVLFYRQDMNNEEIAAPHNFLKCYTKSLRVMNRVNSLRINIFKTDNSVPALGKIEVWGMVSPIAGKDTQASIMAMWMTRNQSISMAPQKLSAGSCNKQNDVKEKGNLDEINVPEEFMDPITFEIMTQPVILPSGKIIDQSTLEKHEHNEALWGRLPSDPFTGVQFNDSRKPVAAIPLKARIDQFLVDNSENEDIKKMPRVLGTEIPSYARNSNQREAKRPVGIFGTSMKLKPESVLARERLKRKMFHIHSLPVASLQNSDQVKVQTAKIARTDIPNSTKPQCSNNVNFNNLMMNKILEIDDNLEKSIQNALADLRQSSSYIHSLVDDEVANCDCCSNGIFYKLPCKHFICRKVLLSTKIYQCTICKQPFTSVDPERIR